MPDLISIENFSFSYTKNGHSLQVLRDVNLSIAPGEVVGLVGESGSGKSTLGKSILRIPSFKNRVKFDGKILFNGKDLLSLPEKELDRLRGKEISIVFQDPFSYLNPILTVGQQIREILEHHSIASGSNADSIIIELLKRVKFEKPQDIFSSYPFQLSGGECQRVAICIALVSRPKLLIADEVTSSLDALVERRILDLVDQLRLECGTAVLLISHNLHTVVKYADRIAIVYAGILMEVTSLGSNGAARHPYTQALFNCTFESTGDGRFLFIDGNSPDPSTPVMGCPFRLRGCRQEGPLCAQNIPVFQPYEGGWVRCHYPLIARGVGGGS